MTVSPRGTAIKYLPSLCPHTNYLNFRKDTYHCRVLSCLLLEISLLSDMQCQALEVNSSEELVLVHSLYNAEDVLKNARGKKKNEINFKKYWMPLEITHT